MTAQRAKVYELVLFNNIFVQLFWSIFWSIFNYFWFYLVEDYLIPFIFKLIQKWNMFNFGSQFRSTFRTLTNIQDGGFCIDSERLLLFDYFLKKLHPRKDSQFNSKASYNIAEKASPQIFGRVLNLPLITSKNLQP